MTLETTPTTATGSDIPNLSEFLAAGGDSSYRFNFIGEGAANLVFEILPIDGSNASEDIKKMYNDKKKPGNLLRVPKSGTQAFNCQVLHAYWKTAVEPLFEPGDLAQLHLIRLGSSSQRVVSLLTAALEENETSRRGDFQGSKVSSASEYGMLIENMSMKQPSDLVLEFKPKWLAQSPNAPPSSTRCRNCAREAYRRNHHHPSNKKKQKSSIPIPLCQLDFLACSASRGDPAALNRVLERVSVIKHQQRPTVTTPTSAAAQQQQQYASLVNWLRTNTLLSRLRDMQVANDPHGSLAVTSAEDDDDASKLQLAMTLRDCSCYVRISAPTENCEIEIEAKLADLDKKNRDAKLGYWQATERELIEGGYYEGMEEPRQETHCQLGRLPKHTKYV
ncbi:inositol pentakisphosphate 2-kinase-like protein [Podospora didyma]|uniref:Inositol-pentakisphosphate 2-kinase n=1 Tax=Podospora didyma TaxID=330526 RepID=A0AAE0KEV7_9PEZI|nr:inositol pentakisphosphate 2-kinase-like protein [Podospora didyma]